MVAHSYIVLPPIIDIWFQVLFHSLSRVLFTFPSRYSFTIGHQVVFSLIQWSGQILTEFLVLRDTWECNYRALSYFKLRDYNPLWSHFPERSFNMTAGPEICIFQTLHPTTPALQRIQAYTTRVWAIPISLTTTYGITLFSFPSAT